MQTRLPPLNSLRAFEASARHRSFTRAADELNVTPAAISHQIKGLEGVLGARLFRRAKGTLMLTEEGQRLLPGVRKGFVAFAEAMENFALYHQTGPLNVALTPSFAAKWLIPRIEHFNARHPEIDIRITTTMDLIDYERDGVDIGVRFGRGGYGDLVVELLLASEVTPVCSPHLLEGGKPLEKPSDLARFTLLHDESPLLDETHPNWAMWLKAAEVTNVDASHGLRFDNASACINAAIEGAGVCAGADRADRQRPCGRAPGPAVRAQPAVRLRLLCRLSAAEREAAQGHGLPGLAVRRGARAAEPVSSRMTGRMAGNARRTRARLPAGPFFV